MSELTIRPSAKRFYAGMLIETILIVIVAYMAMMRDSRYWYLLAVPLAIGTLSALRLMKKRSSVIRVAEGKLRYESGIASKTTRTLELDKIQDVRVEQTLLDRVLGVGTITVVTASESGSVTLGEIDGPQQVADGLLTAARERKREF
jgi:membrane protein YdbS with pleckstrin-like domain